MNHRFQYMLIGAVLALSVIGIALSLGFSESEAKSDAVAQQIEGKSDESAPTTVEVESVPSASQGELSAHEDHSDQESTITTGDNTNDSHEGSFTGVPASRIVATVKEFAARHEAALLGQPGWILIKEVEVTSDEQRQGDYGSPTGVAVPFQELVPADSPIFENWAYVDETGLYHEGLGLVTSADGAVHQHTVLLDGQWIHMTLRARGFPQTQTISSHDFVRVVLPSLRVAQSLEDIATLPSVRLTARLDGGRYIVVQESTYDEPFNLGTPELPELPAPAVGDITTYIFDTEMGQLVSEEVYYILEDGSRFLVGSLEYHVEFMMELPADRAPLYYDAVNELKGER